MSYDVITYPGRDERHIDEPAIDLAQRAGTVGEPDTGECLDCYVNRMLNLFSCVGDQRFTRYWFRRQPQLPRRLRAWMRKLDDADCDCQVVCRLLDRMPRDGKHALLRCPTSYRLEQGP